jgi:predicted transcriptional regulator
MKLLSLKLPDTLDYRLAHAASRRKSTKSEVVREAIAAYLAETGKDDAGSALTLAKDLAGIVTGPADLSTNPAHLKHFGRPSFARGSARGDASCSVGYRPPGRFSQSP